MKPTGGRPRRVKPTKSFRDSDFGGFHPPYWDRLYVPTQGRGMQGYNSSVIIELVAGTSLRRERSPTHSISIPTNPNSFINFNC